MRINDLQKLIDNYRLKSREKTSRRLTIELKVEHELAFAELETFLERVSSQQERTTDTLSQEELGLLTDIVTYRSKRLIDIAQKSRITPHPIDNLHKEIAAQLPTDWSLPKTNKVNKDLLIQFLFIQDDIAIKTLSKFDLTDLFKKLTLEQKENFIQYYLSTSALSQEIFTSTIDNLTNLCNFVSLLPQHSIIEFLRKTNYLNVYLDASEKKYSQSLAALFKILNLHPNKGELLNLLNHELLNTFLDREHRLDNIYENYTQFMQVNDGINTNEYATNAVLAEEPLNEALLAEEVNNEQDVISDTESIGEALESLNNELAVEAAEKEVAQNAQPSSMLDNIDSNNNDVMLTYEEMMRFMEENTNQEILNNNNIIQSQSLTSSDGMTLSSSIGDLRSFTSSSISTQNLKRKAEDNLEEEQSSEKRQKLSDTTSAAKPSNPNRFFQQNSTPATPIKGSLKDSICCINVALTDNKFLEAFYYIEKAHSYIQHNLAYNFSTFIKLQECAMQAVSIMENRNTLLIEIEGYKRVSDGRKLNIWLDSMLSMMKLMPQKPSLAQLELVESIYRELHRPVPSYTFMK